MNKKLNLEFLQKDRNLFLEIVFLTAIFLQFTLNFLFWKTDGYYFFGINKIFFRQNFFPSIAFFLSLIYCFFKKKKIFNSNWFMVYLLIFFDLIMISIDLIFSPRIFSIKEENYYYLLFFNLIFPFLFLLFFLFLYLKKYKIQPLRDSIFFGFKCNFFHILFFSNLFLVFSTILDQIFNSSFSFDFKIFNHKLLFLTKDLTENEKRIDGLIRIIGPIYYLRILFFSPIIEEIVYRYGFFAIIKNKKIAFLASFLIFPFAHISSNFDWEHYKNYLLFQSFFLPFLFAYVGKFNISYSIFFHFLINFSVFMNKLLF
jgi:hypothetical protein